MEAALEDARALLRERRITLNDGDTIAAFAKDMAKYLSASDIAESKAFIRSFVREVAVASGMATIRYTIPISQSTTKTEVLMGGGLGCRWEWWNWSWRLIP